MAFGNHVAADPRRRRAGALSPFPAAFSHGAETGGGAGIISAGGLERTGILPPRPHAACRGEDHRQTARRKISRRRSPNCALFRASAATRRRQSPASCSMRPQPWWMEMLSACWGVCSGPIWQARPLANRRSIAEPQAARRFQPGHDGTGRDSMPASPAPMFRLSGVCPVRDARESRAPEKTAQEIDSPETAGDLLRARSPRRFDFPGAAPETCVADARHVGVAGNTCCERGRASASLTLRHSITVTDYTVRVMRGPVPVESEGRWVPKTRIRSCL